MERADLIPPQIVDATERRDLYWGNAIQALNEREYPKVAELLWGAVTQEWIRAGFFLSPNNEIIGVQHAQYKELCRNLSKSTEDSYFIDTYDDLNKLHGFFYRDVVLAEPERAIPDLMKQAAEMIRRLEHKIDKVLK